MNPAMILAVAVGGAAGSVARYLTMIRVGALLGTGFPYATLAVNILGSFVMGVLVELWALVWSPPQELRVFLTVGVLGGFTTFSTFSLDVAVLVERNDWMAAVAYVTASVGLGAAALFLALALVRQLV